MVYASSFIVLHSKGSSLQKGNSLSARCVGVCLFKRTYASVRNTNHEVGAAILKKRGRKWTKQDEIRRKVHLFLWNEIEFPISQLFVFENRGISKQKSYFCA